jgi:hypothetical protein
MSMLASRTGLRTGMGGGGSVSSSRSVEGRYTATVYGLIRDGKYADAISVLALELQSFPRSRAALSLMGYSYYYLQDFRSSAQVRVAGSGARRRAWRGCGEGGVWEGGRGGSACRRTSSW